MYNTPSNATFFATFFDLPRDLYMHIFGHMCSYERSKVCTVSKLFKDIAISVSMSGSLYPNYYTDPSKYFELINEMETATRVKDKKAKANNVANVCHRIINNQDYHLIVRLKCKHLITFAWPAGMVGYLPTINLILFHDKNYDEGVFFGACEGGHVDLAKQMLDKLRNTPTFSKTEYAQGELTENINSVIHAMIASGHNWAQACYCAGVGGKEEIVKMIHNELTVLNQGFNTTYANRVLCGASAGGHKILVEWAIQNGAKDFGEAFVDACGNNRLHIIKLLKEKYNQPAFNYTNEGICVVSSKGFIEIIEYMHTKGYVKSWDDITSAACSNNQMSIIKYAADQGADKCGNCTKSLKKHGQNSATNQK